MHVVVGHKSRGWRQPILGMPCCRDKWPDSYWDDWMRMREVRQGRQCIRPEVGPRQLLLLLLLLLLHAWEDYPFCLFFGNCSLLHT